jgi:branched-chain amino acid transport system substrate-binding protein
MSRTAVRLQRFGAAGACLALGIGLAACSGSTSSSDSGSSSSTSSSGKASGPIQLGTIDAMTGDYAVLGAQVNSGVVAAVDAVNKAGGLLGQQIKLTTLDDQSSATMAQQQVSQLKSQYKAVAIMGPEDSTSISAAVPEAANLQLPDVVSSAAWPNGLSTAQTAWAWSATVNTTDGIERYITYFKQHNIKSVAIIGNGTPFSQQLQTYFSAQGSSLPFKIVANEQFTAGATDVSPQISRALAAKPQFVLSWVSGTDQVNVIKTYKRLGSSVPLGINGGNAGSAVRKAIGDANLQGVFCLAYPTQFINQMPSGWTSKQAAQQYLSDMQAAGKDADGGASNAVLGWDAAMTLIDGIKAAGSTSNTAIQQALDAQTYVGATSTFHRTADAHSAADPGGYVLAQSQGSAWKLVLAAQPGSTG